MVTDRHLQAEDYETLVDALERDEYHSGMDATFFVQPGTLTKVYEDSEGPVLFARASKSLRLDLQYLDNGDVKRNMRAMLEGFPALLDRARANGFKEVLFNTDQPLLAKWCCKRLGFTEVSGTELRRYV